MTSPVVGIIGGGQLARMLAEAATPLGVHVRVLAAAGDEGAAEVVPDLVIGSPDDPAAVVAFGRSVDVVTFDHENVDLDALATLEAEGVAVRPGLGTLRFADKAHQRRSFLEAGLPIPEFVIIDTRTRWISEARSIPGARSIRSPWWSRSPMPTADRSWPRRAGVATTGGACGCSIVTASPRS